MFKMSFTILCALLLLSCKDSHVNNQSQSNNKVFFESEFINHAWGVSYRGWMVDQDGSICSYNPAQDTVPVMYNSDGYYTEQELRSKYEHVKVYQRKIAEDSLRWSHAVAAKVVINDFSDTTGARDMGRLEYSVYIFRPQITKYQKILLRVEGDLAFYNKSESAIELVTWLKQL